MSIIDIEIEEVRKLCENVVPNSKIIACTAGLVRVDIQRNQLNRQVTVCIRFPVTYPNQHILVELKSKTLSEKFLNRLVSLCEKKAQEHLGKTQCLPVLRFMQEYVQENPLCICFDEIQALRKDLGSNASPEQLKLKQKTSAVILTAKIGAYFYRVKAIVPDDYPEKCVDLRQQETNLPAILLRYLNGQSREIARQCVEAPLRLTKGKTARDFKPVPSLYKALKFCLEATCAFPNEHCPVCELVALPENPNDLEIDDSKDAYVERVYCGHLFHQGCLKLYLQEPPFPKYGKLCPARQRHVRSDTAYNLQGNENLNTSKNEECGTRLAHDRWVTNTKIAESRWAQKQARRRELEEVVDFLK
uniref:RWD domain-containing protein n=1 Tax=Glossina brevipalpis TaxID=37001 RepID=A0A1A9W6M4_9MUSC